MKKTILTTKIVITCDKCGEEIPESGVCYSDKQKCSECRGDFCFRHLVQITYCEEPPFGHTRWMCWACVHRLAKATLRIK